MQWKQHYQSFRFSAFGHTSIAFLRFSRFLLAVLYFLSCINSCRVLRKTFSTPYSGLYKYLCMANHVWTPIVRYHWISEGPISVNNEVSKRGHYSATRSQTEETKKKKKKKNYRCFNDVSFHFNTKRLNFYTCFYFIFRGTAHVLCGERASLQFLWKTVLWKL